MLAIRFLRRPVLAVFLCLFFYSSAHAASWLRSQPPDPDGRGFHAVAIGSQSPAVVYLSNDKWVWKSIDGGDNWQLTSLPAGFTKALFVDPSNNSRVWAARPQGVYQLEGSTVTPFDFPGEAEFEILSLGGSKKYPDDFYLGTASKFWKYTDEWEPVMGATYRQVFAMIQDPNDEQRLFAATDQGVLALNPENGKWLSLGSTLYGSKVQALAVHPTNSQILYAGLAAGGRFKGGIYRTADGGLNWSPINSGITGAEDPTTLDVLSVVIDKQNPARLYALVGDRSIYQSDNDGIHWRPFGYPLAERISRLYHEPLANRFYALTSNGFFSLKLGRVGFGTAITGHISGAEGLVMGGSSGDTSPGLDTAPLPPPGPITVPDPATQEVPVPNPADVKVTDATLKTGSADSAADTGGSKCSLATGAPAVWDLWLLFLLPVTIRATLRRLHGIPQPNRADLP